MSKIKVIILIGCLVVLIGTVGACNKTGSKSAFFELHPRILIHESNLGSGKNLKVSVVDKRRRNVLLRKESDRKIKSGRALVTRDYHPSVQLDFTFQKTAQEAFQMQGYQMDGKGTGSFREVIIYITKLDLRLRRDRKHSGDQSMFQARLRSKMKISARNQGRTYNKEYEFFIKKSYDVIPGKKDNEKILNYGLTQLLHQIMDDPKLTRFLTG